MFCIFYLYFCVVGPNVLTDLKYMNMYAYIVYLIIFGMYVLSFSLFDGMTMNGVFIQVCNTVDYQFNSKHVCLICLLKQQSPSYTNAFFNMWILLEGEEVFLSDVWLHPTVRLYCMRSMTLQFVMFQPFDFVPSINLLAVLSNAFSCLPMQRGRTLVQRGRTLVGCSV